ncbi:MAG: hypothetical protein FJX80_10965 [Bacteroidetes bacterium]|nr:hypothetical protein [Bacteroidota bacterium]
MKTPRGLVILSVFSLINSGFFLLSTLGSLIIGKPDEGTIKEADLELKKQAIEYKKLQLDYVAELLEKLYQMNQAFMDAYYAYYTVLLLVFSIGVAGVILMLKRIKLGFHLYITYSILGIGHLYLFAAPNIIPTPLIVISLFFSGLFIFLYSRFLPWMNLEET